jgi:hypothetical protein
MIDFKSPFVEQGFFPVSLLPSLAKNYSLAKKICLLAVHWQELIMKL